jgi:pimeloyl-ACP methyl ester carboxylesterase
MCHALGDGIGGGRVERRRQATRRQGTRPDPRRPQRWDILAAPGVVTFDQEHRYEQLTGGDGSDKPFPSESQIAKALGDPSGFDVRPYLGRLDVPVLWLLGGRDKEIPLRASLAILDRFKRAGKDYTVKVYPAAGHGLFDVPPTSAKALPDTLAWLRAHN